MVKGKHTLKHIIHAKCPKCRLINEHAVHGTSGRDEVLCGRCGHEFEVTW